ncbi:hypothetical protein [Nocardia sp. NPDC051570]|uniref:hypothetical protein n=1 Tax=Nocardia sp. NPDC051570 TaxID=3364324 RepID=UPI0037AB043C
MDTDDVLRLLVAAEGSEATLRSTIDELGPGHVANLLTREIVFRARLGELAPRLSAPVGVSLDFRCAGRSFDATVVVEPSGVRIVEEEAEGQAVAVLAQDLDEAVRAVYGPYDLAARPTPSVRWPQTAVMASAGQPGADLPSAFYPVVQRVFRSLTRGGQTELAELAVECGTDKWSALHRYPEHYDRHFAPLRERRLKVLEIGVGGFTDPKLGAASLRMWKHYFPRAIVYGLDVEDKRVLDEPRVVTVRGDQSDWAVLTALAERAGPFDIMIDDGSHVSADVLASFRVLFDHLCPEGLYVIEDLQTSYWQPMFGGDDRDLTNPRHTMGFLKTLLDGLHHEEFLHADARRPQPTDRWIRGMHFYHNLCFLEKGPNAEGAPFAEILRRWEVTGQGPSGT